MVIGFQMISERKEPKYFDTECNGFSVVFSRSLQCCFCGKEEQIIFEESQDLDARDHQTSFSGVKVRLW